VELVLEQQQDEELGVAHVLELVQENVALEGPGSELGLEQQEGEALEHLEFGLELVAEQ
jgi:hypothetical protein